MWSSIQSVAQSAFATYPYSILSWTAVAGVSLCLLRRYIRGSVSYSKAKLDGKTAIVTGANTGIGLETAVDFAQRNGRVTLACRSQAKGEAAVEEVKKRSGNINVVFMELDLASFASIRRFCLAVVRNEKKIDILVNNAGVFCNFAKSADDIELQFAVNYLGSFLLTRLLLDTIKQSPKARIVNVSSEAYTSGKIDFDNLRSPDENSYRSFPAYAQSKLGNIIFTRSLAQKLQQDGVIVNAVHPGTVYTEIARNIKFLVC